MTLIHFKFENSEPINILCVFNFVILKSVVTLTYNKNEILNKKG